MANLHLMVNEEIKQQVKDIAKAKGMNLSTLVDWQLGDLSDFVFEVH